MRDISEKFGHAELVKLYQLLNSPEFQAPLTNYNCGDPVPKLSFAVSLRPKSYATTRAVEIYHSPGLSPAGHTRGLLFGVGFLLDKAVASIDPDPHDETTREPHCDCSLRDSNQEWVTFPGPDIILASAKVAAKNAARMAGEAQEEKLENLQTIHFDPSGVQVAASIANEKLTTREHSLGHLPGGTNVTMLAVDASLNHWACVVARGAKQSVILDGVEGPQYDEIPYHQRLAFSRDGRHFAYIANRNGKMMVVLDGKEGKAYREIEDLFHPIFSPDGNHLAYIASKPAFGFPPEQSFVVLDGREQKSYDLVEGILFSPSGNHLAYNADKRWNRGTSVVVDGKEGKPYDQVVGTSFSLDGNRLGYVAYNRTNRSPESLGMDFAVLDGKEGKQYQGVFRIQFSPDGKHVAYIATKGSFGMRALVRDDVERNYGNVESGPFSPDSEHLAYVALFGSTWAVLIDGKKLDPHTDLLADERMFSPVRDLTFSPDSRHLAYLTRGTNDWSIVLDGIAISGNAGMSVQPVFSPDSRHLAYVVNRDGGVALVLGGQQGNKYDEILAPDSGTDDTIQPTALSFNDQGILHAVAIRDGEVFRLDLELVKQ